MRTIRHERHANGVRLRGDQASSQECECCCTRKVALPSSAAQFQAKLHTKGFVVLVWSVSVCERDNEALHLQSLPHLAASKPSGSASNEVDDFWTANRLTHCCGECAEYAFS